MLPVTVRVNAPEPAIAPSGEFVVIEGAGSEGGAETEKLAELETADPFDTVITAFPGVAVSVTGMIAVSSVAFTNVVGRGKPFQFTTDMPSTKLVPFT